MRLVIPMKYSLRSLMIVGMLGPALLAAAWFALRQGDMRQLAIVGLAILLAQVFGCSIYFLVLRLRNFRP